MKRVFIRTEWCTGCKTCKIACAVEHFRSKRLLAAMMELPPCIFALTLKPSPVIRWMSTSFP